MLLLSLTTAVSLAGPCKDDDLAKGVEAFAFVEAVRLPELAAVAAAEACRFPAPVKQGLEGLAMVGPGQRPLLDLQLAIDAVDAWVAACPAGPQVLADMASLPASAHRGHLFDACGLDEGAGFTRGEWTASDSPLRVAPLLVPALLRGAGADEATVRAYARALAGISDRPEDNQVDTFVPLYPE